MGHSLIVGQDLQALCVWFVLGVGVLHVQLRYRDGTVVKINTVKQSGGVNVTCVSTVLRR